MNQKSLFSLVLLISLWGCNIDDSQNEAKFQGLVIDCDINSPVPGVNVILKRFDGLGYPFNENYIGLILDSAVTDENGLYYFKIDQNDKPWYLISTSKISYYEKPQSPLPLAKMINYSSINQDTILIGRPGFLKFDLVNIPDDFDSIYIFSEFKSYRLFPQINDTTILENYLFKDSNQVYVIWNIVDKPIENSFDTTIQLIPLDTVSLQIDF
jgi:hypothetical protein